ncbi:hypothetical protein CDC06_25795, partial [Pseudomonas aeruginosa]
WRSESPFTVGFRAYVGFWFHCSPNPNYRPRARRTEREHPLRNAPDLDLRLAQRERAPSPAGEEHRHNRYLGGQPQAVSCSRATVCNHVLGLLSQSLDDLL